MFHLNLWCVSVSLLVGSHLSSPLPFRGPMEQFQLRSMAFRRDGPLFYEPTRRSFWGETPENREKYELSGFSNPLQNVDEYNDQLQRDINKILSENYQRADMRKMGGIVGNGELRSVSSKRKYRCLVNIVNCYWG